MRTPIHAYIPNQLLLSADKVDRACCKNWQGFIDNTCILLACAQASLVIYTGRQRACRKSRKESIGHTCISFTFMHVLKTRHELVQTMLAKDAAETSSACIHVLQPHYGFPQTDKEHAAQKGKNACIIHAFHPHAYMC
jgi:hypothetical protein